MKYPTEKYTIIKHQHPEHLGTEVLAISSYAGKAVKGKAICHVDDEFSEEKGIRLAVARCAERIAEKRMKRAARKLAEAEKQLCEARQHYTDMMRYLNDAVIEKEACELDISNILNELR